MCKVYSLFIGLLVLFSVPAHGVATQEKTGPNQDHPDPAGYFYSEKGRLAGWTIALPKQSLTSTMIGLGLIGFVVVNAKRKERV